ncbi:MAG: hypothetical protein ABIB79_05235 [archaeon]
MERGKIFRRGQLKISFGMIFSIILIIIFLVLTFYVIKILLNTQKDTTVLMFIDDLQKDINKMLKGPQGSDEFSYNLPKNIEAVCFTNDPYQNLEFESDEYIDGTILENIDIEETTKDEDPYCVSTSKGKINLRLSKGYGENSIIIE